MSALKPSVTASIYTEDLNGTNHAPITFRITDWVSPVTEAKGHILTISSRNSMLLEVFLPWGAPNIDHNDFITIKNHLDDKGNPEAYKS